MDRTTLNRNVRREPYLSDLSTLAWPKERDACGVGFIADIEGRKTHRTVERAVEASTKLNASRRGVC